MTEQLGDVAKEVKRHRPGGQKDSISKRLVTAFAASAASAATAYAVKKAPELFREKVLPKIRERGGVEKLGQDLLHRVKEVVESASQVELPGISRDGRTAGNRSSPRRAVSNAQRKKDRQGRAKRRQARRQALSR
jgi:hypothetical protein